MNEFIELLTPEKTTVITKGWGTKKIKGLKKNSIGEIYAWHKEDEKDRHKFNAETVKVLYFEQNKKCSLHFHKNKDEIFMVCYGVIEVETIEKTGEKRIYTLFEGDRIFIPNHTPHRMKGINELNIMVEVSTHHEDEDSFRIEKGD